MSRAGLSETEILDLTAALNGWPETKRLYWSQLFNAAAGYLTTRNGLVGFSHEFIRDAVWKRYLSPDTETKYRRCIAGYMKNSALRERKYDELLHQLFVLKDWIGSMIFCWILMCSNILPVKIY